MTDRDSEMTIERGDEFDLALGQFEGTPVLRTAVVNVQIIEHMGIRPSRLFILQTVRVPEVGDTIFLQFTHPKFGHVRVVLPPKVTAALRRQDSTLSKMARRRGARAAVQTRKERGIEPGFLKKKK